MLIQTNEFNEARGAVTIAQVPGYAVRPRPRLYAAFGKRFFDIAAVVLSLPFVLPLVAVIAILASLNGGSPLYFQRRIGRHGKIFRLVKIRTMVPNADALLKTHLDRDPAAKAEWDSTQKLKNDPRITSIGRFLRKSSLDELPQLWNVLVGDMSLIGPRPMMVDQQSLYPGTAYYALRPGISGAWQVSDRNNSSFADRAKFDNEYYMNVSFSTDVKILIRTVSAVTNCTGY
jgi:exopolysaccharide production protein ExoY